MQALQCSQGFGAFLLEMGESRDAGSIPDYSEFNAFIVGFDTALGDEPGNGGRAIGLYG